jgi:hypothetical protein
MEGFKKNWQPIVYGVAAVVAAYFIYKYSTYEDSVSEKRKGPFQSVIAGTVNWEALQEEKEK